jgi:hypothetical protein
MFCNCSVFPTAPSLLIPTYYVSAPCGTGKTWAAGKYIVNHRSDANFLYVAPTKKLLKQTKWMLKDEHRVNGASIITSDTNPDRAKRAIVEYLKGAEQEGQVLLITHSAYLNLPYFHRRERWKIFIDEIPQFDIPYKWRLPTNWRLVAEHVEVERAVNESVFLIRARDRSKLKRQLENPHDDVFDVFRPMLHDLLNENRQVFVNRQTRDRLEGIGFVHTRKKEKSSPTNNYLYFVSILHPHAFENVTLLGANLEHSLLFHWLKRFHGRPLIEDASIKADLRPVTQVGARLQIKYFCEADHGFTKHLGRKGSHNDEITNFDAMDAKAKELFRGKGKYLVVRNNSRQFNAPFGRISASPGTSPIAADRSAFDDDENAREISVYSHGRNDLSDVHNIYFSAALNRETWHNKMLNDLGFSSEQIQIATADEAANQCLMRTSLRNPNSNKKVTLICPDKAMGETIGCWLGCQDIEQISGVVKERKAALSGSQRNARWRAKQRLARTRKNDDEIHIIPKNVTTFPQSAFPAKDMFPSHPSSVFVTFHESRYANTADQHVRCEFHNIQDLIKCLRQYSRTPLDKKEEGLWMNAATFDPGSRPNGYRLKECFVQSSCLILDFDNGELSPDAFIDLFYSKARRYEKRSFVVFNSFSRCPEVPNKFRVILFYKRAAKSIAEHKAVYDNIVRRLKDNGYPPETSGLDSQCRTGVQSFFMPCTNRAHPKWRFFAVYGNEHKEDLVRLAIDPEEYAKTAEVGDDEAIVGSFDEPASAIDVSHHKIEEIVAPLRLMTEGRRRPIFDAANDLAKSGLNAIQVESELIEVVGHIPHLRRHVTESIKSLKRYHGL